MHNSWTILKLVNDSRFMWSRTTQKFATAAIKVYL